MKAKLIMWVKQNPTKRVIDLLGLRIDAKHTLKSVTDLYCESIPVGEYKTNALYMVRIVAASTDMKQRIVELTAGDLNKAMSRMAEKRGETQAYNGRAVIIKGIYLAATGEIPTSSNGRPPAIKEPERATKLKFIFWTKQPPNKKVVDLLGLTVDAKHTIKSVTDLWLAQMHDKKKIMDTKYRISKLSPHINMKSRINDLTAADMVRVFRDMIRGGVDESKSHAVRGMLCKAIYFAATGEMGSAPNEIKRVRGPAINATPSATDEPDIGKLTFSRAKIADIAHLVPLYSMSGRFGWIKAEVQKQVHSLEDGEAGVIQAPRRSMTEKEAKSICGTVRLMFKRGSLPWIITFNPNESVFIVMRSADFEKLTKQ